MTRKYPIVEILWTDSASQPGWKNPENVAQPGVTRCRTVGYLFERSAKEVIVVQNRHDLDHPDMKGLNDAVGHVMAIPTRGIQTIRRLGTAAARTKPKARRRARRRGRRG